ncbi:MAG: phosphatase PAP2 family protein [Hoeflea sp.]|uniref:phosphatase PAP2 family protein n=1 Tax=Hoeflea sp. TaxID=1940281 RepID=UPI001D5851C9|nr:phosphatase PAP2 family protein [Hoeflea sp.]MBU4527174.1 phosphatase PAP2 family protein [Alphaproteobacteria bacterium]MBU4544809.1 phosphatase PAP2 family protein [Alphaproteobacteria bacterium]MBU4551445.1 phosphatase PAP2 family protein [Alphaproteobacteria bacterium]MBV1725450.1 phosphatase PAP2 family protein [Hoeflea sp.]MBV1759498.1 phosphatase PAP2 family protein [Hoeflea sp.]
MYSCLETFRSEVLSRLRLDAWFYATVLAYTAFGLVYLQGFGQLEGTSHSAYVGPGLWTFAFFMPTVVVLFDLVRVVHRFDRRRRLAFRRSFSSRRLAGLVAGMAVMVGITLFQGTFTSIKISFANIHGGFPWDLFMADADRLLHFGNEPWQLLYGLAQNPALLTFIEINYNVFWHLICFGALFFVVTSPSADRVRMHYLAMFLFVWIVCGNILANMFLSAGPVYYGHVTGDHARFGGQLAFLATSDAVNSAARIQNYLWVLYERGQPGIGGGISAFPSVHVALITMNALFLASYSQRLGVAAFVYVGFVLMSSVYLGWHYAVDGYVSIILVALAYHLSRRAFARSAPGAIAVGMPGRTAAAAA